MVVSKVFTTDLVLDAPVRTTFLVTAKSVRQTKYGDPFLCVTLSDRTGSVEGRAWENAEGLAAGFEPHDYVLLTGSVTSYQDQVQLKVLDVTRVPESDIEVSDYLPTSRWQPEAMFAQLKDLLLSEVEDPTMLRFFQALLSDQDLMHAFIRSPAAKANHHDYIGGLLEHVLSMTRVAVSLANHYAHYYPGLLNKDLLMAGCVLHDLGKVRELSFRRGFDYTTHGQLIGHIVHGVELIGALTSRMSPSPPEDLVLELKHLVISHHGRLEYGSPVKPPTPEAMLLHQIDMIDSRMNMFHKVARSVLEGPLPDARWSGYQRNLETRIYLPQRPDPGASELEGPGQSTVPKLSRSNPSPPPPRRDPRTSGVDEMNLNLFSDS